MKHLYLLAFLLVASTTHASITFYEHTNFQGSSHTIDSDWSYTHNQGWNDQISSVAVPQGWKVVLYEHNWGGRSMTLTSDWTANSWNDFWNDRVSSIRVIPPVYGHCGTRTRTEAQGITLFEHSDFGGARTFITQTTNDLTRFQWNDAVSSIAVPAGWSVVLYEHANFGGHRITVTSNWTVRNWNDFWNDRISSIEVIAPRRQAVSGYRTW